MNYVYIEGFAGNGFEDAGVDIHEVKIFTNKSEALAHSGEKFCRFAQDFLGNDVEDNDMSVDEMAERLNGTCDISTGCWECSPESTSFGKVVAVH